VDSISSRFILSSSLSIKLMLLASRAAAALRFQRRTAQGLHRSTTARPTDALGRSCLVSWPSGVREAGIELPVQLVMKATTKKSQFTVKNHA